MMLDMIRQAATEQTGGALLSAGYPDMLVQPAHLEAILGKERAARVPMRPDSAAILGWHGLQGWMPAVPDSAAVMRELGYTLDVIDIHASRGDELIVDLNLPLPHGMDRRYDIVLDTGTCEHCFNIGQAAANLASLVRQGGFLVQALPLSSFNHGFYNVNPTWFHDFYPANGYRLLLLNAVTGIVKDPKIYELPPTARFNEAPPNAVMVVVAKREVVQPVVFPTQAKYRANPGLKAG
jgi:hypothetical protein